MLLDLNENYISVFVRKFAFSGCGLQLHILLQKCKEVSILWNTVYIMPYNAQQQHIRNYWHHTQVTQLGAHHQPQSTGAAIQLHLHFQRDMPADIQSSQVKSSQWCWQMQAPMSLCVRIILKTLLLLFRNFHRHTPIDLQYRQGWQCNHI